MSPAYASLLKRTRELALLGSTSSLLHWDQETYMPEKANAWRAEQLAHFAGLSHRLWTADEVGGWIADCEASGLSAGSDAAVNVREWRRSYDRATQLPSALVEECSKTEALAHQAWVGARARNDFPAFQPLLTQLVELARRKADLWGYTESRYDALLDAYEPGTTASTIESLFEGLAPRLSRLVAEGAAAQDARPAPPLPAGTYPVEAQQALNREVAAALGFDFEAGRIDTTAHPFCTELGPNDCRLTTRYDTDDFTSSLYGIMHETGHGLYDQGLPGEHYGTPCGTAVSLGIHESQSRLWENHIGRSRAFWEHWFARAVHHFPQLKASSPEALWRHVNRIERSFIRVEADEVTYDLHIILRFRIERRLIEGDLEAADVPAFWNESFHQLFGLTVPDDRRGCLQDIHWSMGGFGYFPTYTLGNLNAALLMNAATRDLPRLPAELAAGQYGSLLGWLREKIHQPGMHLRPLELMRAATGQEVTPEAHLAHLAAKVSA
ncbi:MAG: carboxypeptidase M32 [Candidatus Methylacidiphilales bacterium]|nr:carboxypeptidase M32 [Candidatus Methylacidiphilales bacterium]